MVMARKSLQAQRSGANVLMDYGASLCLLLLTGFIGRVDELVTLYIIIVLRPVCPLPRLHLSLDQCGDNFRNE